MKTEETNEGICSVPSPPPLPSVSKQLTSKFNSQPSEKGKRFLKELQFRLVGAIESNNVLEVIKIILKGVDLNCIILIHKTPLIYAIERRTSNPKIPELLIEAGANVESPERVSRSRLPIHVAVMAGSLALVKKLLDYNANIDGRDGSGNTPLHYASYYGFQDIAGELISRQPPELIHCGDDMGRTAIHRAIENKHYYMAEMLLYHGARVNVVDNNGWTPLYHCIVFDDVTGIKYLLNRGVDVNSKDINGNTSLHVACNPLGKEFIRMVTGTTMDYYKRTRRMPTSELQEMFMQEKNGSLKNVQLLVNAGADVTCRNNAGTNPAYNTEVPEIMIYLLECGFRLHSYTLSNLEHSGKIDFVIQVGMSEALKDQTRLMRQCRNVIRNCLRQTRDIHSAVKHLPLPQKLIQYINLVDYNKQD